MSTKNIHKTAIVSEDAKIHPSATIGPYAVVEGDVEIGARTVLGPHAIVRQFSRIGENNIIDPNAVIGGLPQHAGFDGSETWVIVGNNNVFREGVTVNRAYHSGWRFCGSSSRILCSTTLRKRGPDRVNIVYSAIPASIICRQMTATAA